tara:strand:+ start:312 stop:542 length:231 start_codon:yes stop_codon:yes gene_type:complete
MNKVFENIKTENLLSLKKTTNLFDPDFEFLIIKRVTSFYSENVKLFIWTYLSPLFQNVKMYVYGNPFVSYNFIYSL